MNVYGTLTFHRHIAQAANTNIASTQIRVHKYQQEENDFQITILVGNTHRLNWNYCNTGITYCCKIGNSQCLGRRKQTCASTHQM
jgi:hypothetical protein